jgi:hypothetical protein
VCIFTALTPLSLTYLNLPSLSRGSLTSSEVEVRQSNFTSSQIGLSLSSGQTLKLLLQHIQETYCSSTAPTTTINNTQIQSQSRFQHEAHSPPSLGSHLSHTGHGFAFQSQSVSLTSSLYSLRPSLNDTHRHGNQHPRRLPNLPLQALRAHHRRSVPVYLDDS